MVKEGFTLIELIIVIIILAIIAGIGIPGYVKTRESSIDREAKASLKIIQAAEDSYNLETGEYYISGAGFMTDLINSNLILRLNDNNWSYCVKTDSAGFVVDAVRQDYNPGGTARVWRIRPTYKEACCSAGCAQSAGKPECP
ncbi:MAG: prepilin-type N-terminal cleavage/methylation domain-containing protein [Candidatus Gygaella obscura]|nr:prepilin-type N-terminal cleavage/methylation domain-containing protein [Candidatus Gygaella obscura]